MSAAVGPLAAAAARAPDAPGVYFLLGPRAELLYAGKAGSLRRRLQQHARATGASDGDPLRSTYRRVREVRWEEQPDEEAAAVREADLIVALQPPGNASYVAEGRWNYIAVRAERGTALRFELSTDVEFETGRVYGCFAHLGRGVSSRPGIACSDGYTALLRLLWAASGEGAHMPSRITRSAPDSFATKVDAGLRGPLHALLTGTSARLLDVLAAASAARDAYMQPALARDRDAARAFFAHGPRALRRLRLRHGLPPGPVPRAVIEASLAAELREAIGEVRLPALEGARGRGRR